MWNVTKITEEMVGKFVAISYNMDGDAELEILEGKDLEPVDQFHFGIITLEEYNKKIEEVRREHAIHTIKLAKEWIEKYPDLSLS